MERSVNARERMAFRPFAEAALDLQGRGLAIVPLGGDDGKVALKRGYPRWGSVPRARTVAQWVAEHPQANIGILCGLSGIVVIDVDDASLLHRMIERFGETPLIIATRRGYQLWYRARGHEKPANLRKSEGLEVEIKAGPAAIVVVPPSRNRETGHAYTFELGSWDDLPRLPLFTAQGSRNRQASINPLRLNPVGVRNVSLFDYLRHNFSFSSLAQIETEALWFNETYQAEPETVSKVLATARSVWNYMTVHTHRVGGGAYVRLTHSELDALKVSAGGLYPQTLALFVELKRQHAARAARGEPFVISAHGIANERLILGLTNRKRIEQVRRAAEEAGVLIKIREAARELGQFKSALYTFGMPLDGADDAVIPIRQKRKR